METLLTLLAAVMVARVIIGTLDQRLYGCKLNFMPSRAHEKRGERESLQLNLWVASSRAEDSAIRVRDHDACALGYVSR